MPFFMSMHIINSLTQTKWYWTEIQKTFELNFDPTQDSRTKNWIKNYSEYLEYFYSWRKTWKTILKKKIDLLKQNLLLEYWVEVDPIEYIIKLYYEDKLSIKDISIRLKEKWWENKNISSLEKTLKWTFWFELRSQAWSEISSKKRKNNGQIEKARDINNKKNELKYNIVRNFFANHVKDILNIKSQILSEHGFDYENFEELNKRRKILYVLYYIYWINRNQIKKFRDNEIWARIISNYLSENLKWFLKELKINMKIYPKDIQQIFNN